MNRTRLRIGTLMLLIVIVALCIALGIHERRAAHREAELRAKIAEMELDDFTRWKKMSDHRIQRTGSAIQLPPAK